MFKEIINLIILDQSQNKKRMVKLITIIRLKV